MTQRNIVRKGKQSLNEKLYKKVKKFDREGVETILGKGADVNALSSVGKTPLMRAVMNYDGTLIDHLIEKGAEVNMQDKRGWTSLHYAADSGSADLVKQLVEKGANITIEDNKGRTALDVAKARLEKSMENRYDTEDTHSLEIYDRAEGPQKIVRYLEKQ